MKRFLSLLTTLCILSLFATTACQKPDLAEQKQTKEVAQKHAEGLAYNESLKTSGDISPEKAKELQKKLKKEHRILPPKPVVKVSFGDLSANLSNADAQRSYLYREAAIKRCYINTIAEIPEAEGTFTLSLSRQNGSDETAVRDYTATGSIATDDFKNCIADMAKRWPLPNNASLSARFELHAIPAPSVEEFRQQSANGAYKIPAHRHDHHADNAPKIPSDGVQNAQNDNNPALNADERKNDVPNTPLDTP